MSEQKKAKNIAHLVVSLSDNGVIETSYQLDDEFHLPGEALSVFLLGLAGRALIQTAMSNNPALNSALDALLRSASSSLQRQQEEQENTEESV